MAGLQNTLDGAAMAPPSPRISREGRGEGQRHTPARRPAAAPTRARRKRVGGTMSTRGDLLVGVDIGGTFTDVVVRRPARPAGS